ncbi:hypothetical protein ATANTOWER_004974 [Ataeniobius toweri]|uniref:Uncharacterized protein n=1 Tax=Ataeniobius toweri TaxID=208326 RepID=A0ABU7AKL1_9TELE|nr:hypothetical protein [Ataeniobius toweri]
MTLTCRVTWLEVGYRAISTCLLEPLFRPGPDIPAARLPSHHSSVGSPGLASSRLSDSYLFHLHCFLHNHELLTSILPSFSIFVIQKPAEDTLFIPAGDLILQHEQIFNLEL